MKHRTFTFFLCIFLSFLLSGCINYEQFTTLRTDGSGTMEIHYWINQDIASSMTQGDFAFDKESVNKQYEALGVEVKDVRIESNAADSTKHVRVKLKFSDITQLSKASGFKSSGFEWNHAGSKITFKQNFHVNSGSSESMGLDKFTFTYTYNFPGDIVSTNATTYSGRTAVWKFKLSELSTDRSLIAVIAVSWFSAKNIVIALVVVLAVLILFIVLRKKSASANVSV